MSQGLLSKEGKLKEKGDFSCSDCTYVDSSQLVMACAERHVAIAGSHTVLSLKAVSPTPSGGTEGYFREGATGSPAVPLHPPGPTVIMCAQ